MARCFTKQTFKKRGTVSAAAGSGEGIYKVGKTYWQLLLAITTNRIKTLTNSPVDPANWAVAC